MLLEAKNLVKIFKKPHVTALNGVSFCLEEGKTLGVLGESGSGKTTLAKAVMRLTDVDSGDLLFESRSVSRLKESGLKTFRDGVQIIFQDPFLSFDPRMTVAEILEEPLRIRAVRDRRVLRQNTEALLCGVELPCSLLERFPRTLSGGQCQRVAIARALSVKPRLLVCDEPVSSLDWAGQTQVLNLLLKLQEEKGLALLFISHDLKVIRHMSDAILVLKDGRAVEQASREEIFRNPRQAYTRRLLERFFEQTTA